MDPESIVDFLRRGRGVSYHEVELPTGPVEQLAAVTSIAEYSGSNASPPACCYRHRRRCRYHRILARVGPQVHPGFFEESLDLAVQKK